MSFVNSNHCKRIHLAALLAALLPHLGLLTLSAVVLPPVWRWSNPAPHGANIVGLASQDGFVIQVGERGQIFTSDDLQLWIPRDSHTTAYLRAVTFFGGRMVITGEGGTVLFADNPSDYYLLELGTADWLEGVAASPDRVVAVGDQAAIYTSTNAVVWQRVTPPFSNWLRSVAYGAGAFVAVGESGLIATSSDGLTWQKRNDVTSANFNEVRWINNHFLAVGAAGEVFTSSNGNTWQRVTTGASNTLYTTTGNSGSQVVAGYYEARLEAGTSWTDQLSPTLPFPAPGWTYYASDWDGTSHLLTGWSGMLVEGYKENGSSDYLWKTQGEPIRSWLWQVTRISDHYLAVGDYGTILSSPNGIDWEYELVPQAATNSVLLGVGGSSNLFLAVGSEGTILWATNAFFWHSMESVPTENDLQGVCFDGTRFIVSGGSGTLLTSLDGSNWVDQPTSTSAFLMSVAAFPGGYIAVGENGTILKSSDATAWTLENSGTTNWLYQVKYLNDQLVSVGENGTILTSADGSAWTAQLSGTESWLNAVDFVDDTYFVAGNQGAFLASPDATNWFSFGTATRKSFYGMVSHGGQLITVGVEGIILRSQVVPVNTPVNIGNFSQASRINAFLFTGEPDQQFFLESSEDLEHWASISLLELLDGTGTLLMLEDETDSYSPCRFYRTRTLP